MVDKDLDLSDYVEIVKRRKYIVIASFLLFVGLAALVSYLLPVKYRSTGVILIDEQGIPNELVQSAVTTYADQRIQSISRRIFTRTSLLRINKKFNLYSSKNDESILTAIRDAITFEAISADIVDRRSGRPSQATIAVNVAFDHEDPETAQKIANELTALFLKENIVIRTKAANEASHFLSEEAKRLRSEIRQFETQLGQFKQKNLDQLPELNERNLTEIDRLDRELISVDEQIITLLERKHFLDGELGLIDPYTNSTTRSGERVFSKPAQLNLFKAQYPLLLSKYSKNHPGVVRMGRQIRALEAELGVSGSGLDSYELQKQLRDMRTQLTTLQKRYSKNHPDVRKLQKTIKALEATIQESESSSTASKSGLHANNPAYISLKSQLASVETRLRSFEASKRKIEAKQSSIRLRLINTPHIEMEYNSILRDYNDTVKWYQEVRAKARRAKIAQQLETEKKGAEFALLEPPHFPSEPINSDGKRLLLLGFVSAVFGAIILVAIRESTDKTIYGGKRVILATGANPIAVIPYLEDRNDLRTRIMVQRAIIVSGGAVTFILALLFIRYSVDVIQPPSSDTIPETISEVVAD